jgi:putative glutamine transport system substrate-binding protein
MKKTRKLLFVALAVVLVFSIFAGCTNKNEDESTNTEEPTAEPTEAVQDTQEAEETQEAEATAEASEVSEDVQAIIDGGVLKVGVKNAVIGFGFQDTLSGEYSGLEISLAEKIAEYLGVEVEFTAVTAATRTELLDSGDIDCVLATFTITDARKESWDFSTPYFTDYVTVLVENNTGITSLEGLVDKVVGVSSGSTSAKALVTAMVEGGYISGDNFDADTFDAATWTEGVAFQQFDDYPTISTALSAGEIDAFCVDKSILAVYNTDTRSYIEDKFAPQDYGVATKKDSGFSSVVEELISGWVADGTVAALIEENGLS